MVENATQQFDYFMGLIVRNNMEVQNEGLLIDETNTKNNADVIAVYEYLTDPYDNVGMEERPSTVAEDGPRLSECRPMTR